MTSNPTTRRLRLGERDPAPPSLIDKRLTQLEASGQRPDARTRHLLARVARHADDDTRQRVARILGRAEKETPQ